MDKSYPNQVAVGRWIDDVTTKNKGVFDDASSEWQNAPEVVQELAEAIPLTAQSQHKFKSGRNLVLSVMDSAVSRFEKEHGHKPSGAVLDSAIRSTLNSISQSHLQRAGVPSVMDNTLNGSQSDAPLVANRAVLGIYNSIVDAIPFAGYIPMTEAMAGKIIIAQHETASKTGSYQAGASIDGINAGGTFLSASRTVKVDLSNRSQATALITYADDDVEGSPVIPSGTEILINGFHAGGAALNSTVSDSVVQLAGFFDLAGTKHSITGTLTVDTGVVSLNFAPELPEGAEVHVTAILNYEHQKMKDKRPRIQASARSYDFRATYASGVYQLTQEAKNQFALEVRLDPAAEAMIAMRSQHQAERHLSALQSMYRIGKNHVTSINMNAPLRQDERSRASMWRDVLFALTQADVSMIERTNAFGITTLYVGGKGRAELEALDTDVFERSGIPSRAGIYRLGKLFGRFEVYYTPHILTETANSLEILAIGSSEQTGLNPYVIGDVVAPTFMRLGINTDLQEGAGYFYAGANRVNPHKQAASGAAIIAVTGL